MSTMSARPAAKKFGKNLPLRRSPFSGKIRGSQEQLLAKRAPVAQLDRASVYETEG